MSRFRFLIFLFLQIEQNLTLEKARYDNYRVYEVHVENQEQLELLKLIESTSDSYRFIDFPKELIVPPHKFAEFSEFTFNFQLKTRLVIENFQEVLDREQPRRRKSTLDWTRYWRLDEIYTWLRQLTVSHPNDVSLVNVGTSYEGREMLGVRVNFGNATGKKQVIFEETIHAREWISGATVTWMLNELLTSNDADVRALANNYEWLVFPVINVDGYEYTWKRDRVWRKTRRPSSILCYGVDPNRNWDVYFDAFGTSSNPCSDIFAGHSPFSEPETLQFSQYLANLTNLAAYFDFHAYGQMLMLPYGWTHEHLENYDELYDIGRNAIDALKSKYGTEYVVGSIANIIYLASGSSLDWLKFNFKTNVTYAYELRDQGEHAFILPASQIIQTADETFASVVSILQQAQQRGIA